MRSALALVTPLDPTSKPLTCLAPLSLLDHRLSICQQCVSLKPSQQQCSDDALPMQHISTMNDNDTFLLQTGLHVGRVSDKQPRFGVFTVPDLSPNFDRHRCRCCQLRLLRSAWWRALQTDRSAVATVSPCQVLVLQRSTATIREPHQTQLTPGSIQEKHTMFCPQQQTGISKV